MTPQEFKAWFDGFTEAFAGLPNKTQWTRIKARVAEIGGAPVTERVYIDRYWPRYVSTPSWWATCTTNAVVPLSAGSSSAVSDHQ